MHDKENWDRVQKVFEAALQIPLEKQRSFITGRCAGDESLIAEVQSLISAFLSAEVDLEQPPVINLTPQMAEDPPESDHRRKS